MAAVSRFSSFTLEVSVGRNAVCLWRLQRFSRGWPKILDRFPKGGMIRQSLHLGLEREDSNSLIVLLCSTLPEENIL